MLHEKRFFSIGFYFLIAYMTFIYSTNDKNYTVANAEKIHSHNEKYAFNQQNANIHYMCQVSNNFCRPLLLVIIEWVVSLIENRVGILIL